MNGQRALEGAPLLMQRQKSRPVAAHERAGPQVMMTTYQENSLVVAAFCTPAPTETSKW